MQKELTKAKTQSGQIYLLAKVFVYIDTHKTTGYIAYSAKTGKAAVHSNGAWIFPTEELAIHQIKKWR